VKLPGFLGSSPLSLTTVIPVIVGIRTVNVAWKVAIPAFFGFTATTAICIASHFGFHPDVASTLGVIVLVMALLGVIAPPGATSQPIKPAIITEDQNAKV
jgi:hypothetical protein